MSLELRTRNFCYLPSLLVGTGLLVFVAVLRSWLNMRRAPAAQAQQHVFYEEVEQALGLALDSLSLSSPLPLVRCETSCEVAFCLVPATWGDRIRIVCASCHVSRSCTSVRIDGRLRTHRERRLMENRGWICNDDGDPASQEHELALAADEAYRAGSRFLEVGV